MKMLFVICLLSNVGRMVIGNLILDFENIDYIAKMYSIYLCTCVKKLYFFLY